MTLLGLNAQECSSLWVTCPETFVGQEVAYCHTYTDLGELSSASIVVATTGYFRLYVNDNLVSIPSYPMARAPYRDSADITEPVASKFDVSRYMRNDSNTVILLVCPANLDEIPMFSLCINAVSSAGKTLSREADATWVCWPMDAYMTDLAAEYAGEDMANADFASLSAEGLMHCLPVEVSEENWLYDTRDTGFPSYEYINKVIKPKYFSSDWDEKGISYDFGKGFYGLLRVTLRDTKKGQHIYIAGSDYVCNGTNDEQFVLHFAASWFRKVYISGDHSFRLRNVSRVEGLQIVPKITNNFSF